MGKTLLRLLHRTATAVLALVILFEEWGWEPLARLAGRMARLPPLAWLERRIAALPPWGALAVYALPALALLPVKLAALWFVARGRVLAGAALIVLAKLAGTAFVARLFEFTRPALLQIAASAAAWTRWIDWKDALLARVRSSRVWRTGGC
jgi:hypothetical protein